MAQNIVFGPTTLRVQDSGIFGPGRENEAHTFVRRVMALPEVRTVTIDPKHGAATVGFRVDPAEANGFFARLTQSVGSASGELDEPRVPRWKPGESLTLGRFGDRITALQLVETALGKLQLARWTGKLDEHSLRRMQQAVSAAPGVCRTDGKPTTGRLHVEYDPVATDAAGILQVAEGALAAPFGPHRVPSAEPVDFGIANAAVGLGTVGELMLPLATPLTAGILVATNLGVVRDAAVQLSRGKLGVPVFHTALLACSIVTGQVLAYALTDWSLRYWQQRGRKKLAQETQTLLDEALPHAERIRMIRADGSESFGGAESLKVGDRIRVEASEPIPADGRVIGGDALVHETPARIPLRKSCGDEVLAGSTVVAGSLEIETLRVGRDARSTWIADVIIGSTALFPRDHAMQKQAERLADRTVLPTLATAGVGWAAGDLITVGAILHQDWISGPILAVPLQTLQDMRLALRCGALVRNGTAVQRLAESDFVVLDGDHPGLTTPRVELAGIDSRLPDIDGLLRHIAGAALFLGDERASALADACRARQLVIRQPELQGMEPGIVEVKLGEHRLRLRDRPLRGGESVPTLAVEVDGTELATLNFRHGEQPRAADAVARLRALGLQVFVISAQSDQQTDQLVRQLGADLGGGELDTAGRIRFMQGLRRRGVKPTYVGSMNGTPQLVQEAHVTAELGNPEGGVGSPADVVLLGQSVEALADLFELSRSHEAQVIGTSRMATVPNLLCIAGAFAGLLNGITAGIIANIGVMNVDRRIRKSFDDMERPTESSRSPAVR